MGLLAEQVGGHCFRAFLLKHKLNLSNLHNKYDRMVQWQSYFVMFMVFTVQAP